MATKIFQIYVWLCEQWQLFEETEYTEQEARAEIKRLRNNDSGYRFRLSYVRTENRVTLTIKR